MSFLLPLLAACNFDDAPLLPANVPTPSEPPVAPEPVSGRTLELLEPAEAVATADFDGDGIDELILVEDSELLVDGDSLGQIRGTVQHVARGDIDGDGDEEAIIATGSGRQDKEAPAQLWAVHGDGVEVLWEYSGERRQIADLHVIDGRIFFSTFSDSRTVQGGWLTEGRLEVLAEAQLGLAQYPMPDGSLIIGRIYGDEPRSDGDLRRHRGEAVQQLPSLRGVKAITMTDLDNNGEPELLISDGWHYQYGSSAIARVRLHTGDFLSARTLGSFDESYTVKHMEVFGEPGAQGILVTGSKAVHLLSQDALGWKSTKLDQIAEVGNAVVVRQSDGYWAVISGKAALKIPLEL